ncbi:glycosyltransferase, partial [Enterococcus lactis]
PIRIIPTGININKFATQSDFDLRKYLGVDKDAPVLLSVSRLAYEKNIKELINSMPTILADKPLTQLVIVGDGPAGDDLRKQVDDMKLNANVKFVGEINNDEVYKYYRDA